MSYLGIIVSLIILIWFRSRFLNQTFSQLRQTKKWKTFLRGVILVGFLFLYEQIFGWIGINKQIRYIRESFSIGAIGIFLLYSFGMLLGITLTFHNQKEHSLWSEILVAILGLLFLAIGSKFIGGSILLSYYLLVAFNEEILKFTVGNNQDIEQEKKYTSKLIVFSLLIGLSFSISENLLSFITQILHNGTITTSMLLGRGLIASLIHCVATGSIALILTKLKKGNLIIKYTVALFGGFIIHLLYNLAIVYQLSWGIFVIAIIAFIGLSYLLFHLDELYQ